MRLNSKLDQQLALVQQSKDQIKSLQDSQKDFDSIKAQNTDLSHKLAQALKKAAEAKQLQEVVK